MAKMTRTKSNQEIYIQKWFNWDDFDRVRKAIFVAVRKFNHQKIVLDFRKTEVIYPNGITPLIALLKSYQHDGIKISIIPPVSISLNRIARFEGWFHAIDAQSFDPPSTSGYNSLPLKIYTSDDDLNDAVNCAIEVSMRQLLLAKNVPDALEWALNELSGNVLHHAEAGCGYLQVNTFKNTETLSVVVVDGGIGVPSSMKAAFPEIRNDRIAIEHAVQKGVTSKPNFGQGNGLAGCLAIALQCGGYFSLTSGGGRLVVENGKLSIRDFYPALQGTVVEMQLPTNKEIDLPGALWGHKPSSYVEEHYEKDATTLLLQLSECAPTFGNRVTGEKIRTMISNLLTTNTKSDLEIDFSGVKIVASSFADEVFGKLFLMMGPMEFGARIRFNNMNGSCKEIINVAIKERVAQGLQ